MKKIALLLAMLCSCAVNGMAQKITVKDFTVLPRDVSARTNSRSDGNGKGCALIKVDVVGIKDMQFAEAVGNVNYSLSQYNVYVPEDTKTLTYSYGDGQYKGVVKLDAYGVDIMEKSTYRLQFESQDRQRSAVFIVNPQNATVTFNMQELLLDENGMAEQDLPVGKYDYLVTAPGYKSQSGTVSLTDNDVSTLTSVNLEQITHNVQITSNNPDGYLFIDNIPYGKIGSSQNLPLSQGLHKMRLSSQTYKDYTETFTVDADKSIYAATKRMREKEIRHTDERSRRSVNLRNAFYVRAGYSMYDKDNYLTYMGSGDVQIEATYHIFGVFAIHWGLGGGYIFRNHDDAVKYNAALPEKDEDGDDVNQEAEGALYCEIPFQLGLSFPFGNYNLHMFSVFAGGYYRYIYNPGKKWYKSKYSGGSDDNDVPSIRKYDYGLRATARLDIGKFSIGADVSKSLSKDFKGIYMGATVGWKFYL